MIGETTPVVQSQIYREAADGTTVKELTDSSDSIFEIWSPIVFMKKSLGSVDHRHEQVHPAGSTAKSRQDDIDRLRNHCRSRNVREFVAGIIS
jgi:hypothetical protein